MDLGIKNKAATPPRESNSKSETQKRSASSEGRSSSKRPKIQYQPFQLPVHTSNISSKFLPSEEKIVIFPKGEFLTLRNENRSYFVCQTIQNVYKTSRRFKIRWLSLKPSPDANLYKTDFYDLTDIECVLTNVKMEKVGKETYRLPQSEIARTENVLRRAINLENGVDEPELDQIEASLLTADLTKVQDDIKPKQKKVEEEENVVKEEKVTSPRKRGRPSGKVKVENVKKILPRRTGNSSVSDDVSKKKLLINKLTLKRNKSGKVVVKVHKSVKKESHKGGRPKKKKKIHMNESKTEKHSKHPNDKLLPNNNILVYDRDPTFESNTSLPFVSVTAYSKLVIRAVLINDMKLLNRLLADCEHVHTPHYCRSIDQQYNALSYAILQENHKAITTLKEWKPDKERIQPPPCLLKMEDSGRGNFRMFGQHLRQVNIARGSREGNNAFIKDLDLNPAEPLALALKNGVSRKTIDLLQKENGKVHKLYNSIYHAIQHGHRRLAASLIEDAEKAGGFGFNTLHKEVLLYDKQELKPFRAASIKKKPSENQGITPIHCAAINPHSKYLAKLLSLEPEYNITDRQMRRPIHYAAACEGTGPMDFLLSKGLRADEVDNQGNTPLHIAAETGRAHNVDLLLKRAKAEKKEKPEEANVKAKTYGLGGVDRPNKASYTPLHLAAMNGHVEAAKLLVKYGADMEKPVSAAKNKVTALMLACQHGHYGMVKILIQLGATVEKKDKLRRTALTHAVMNGHSHITSYLLSLGADPNTADSSGNTLIHYAAAYGWWFCLQSLLEAGGNPNVPNDWKVTPMSLAFMKGHNGLAELLLEQSGVDIDYKDDIGMTLLMQAISSSLNSNLVDQIRLLVESKKANCLLKDIDGNTALHHLAMNSIKVTNSKGESEINKEAMTASVKIATILMDHGCQATDINDQGKTPGVLAIMAGNEELAKFLLEKAGSIDIAPDKFGRTILHDLGQQCTTLDVAPFIDYLKTAITQSNSSSTENPLKKMAQIQDSDGYTPLLAACNALCNYTFFDESEEMKKKILQWTTTTMQILIADAGSNLATQVFPSKEKENPKKGLWSVMHFLVAMPEIFHDPVLEQILLFKPPLDLVSQEGHTPLISAILNKDVNTAERLIHVGADVNICTSNLKSGKASPLILATKAGLSSVVKLLVQKKADVNATDTNNKFTALHYAAINEGGCSDPLEILISLVNGGAQVNAVDSNQRTPLHLAVNANTGTVDSSTEIEDFLIEKGANLFAKDVRGRMSLHYAFVKIGKHRNYSLLDPIEICSLLTNAMKNQRIDEPDSFGQTPLHLASFRGAYICCMHLIQRKANVNAKDKNGNTPISLSVLGSHDCSAVTLVHSGANININVVEVAVVNKEKLPCWSWKPLKTKPPCNKEYSVLEGAIRHNWQGVMYVMLDKLHMFNITYTFTIEAAIRSKKYRLALNLITKMKDHSKLKLENKEKQNLLHLLAILAEPCHQPELQTKIAQALIERGVQWNAMDCYGCWPITYAAIQRNNSLCEFLTGKSGILQVVNAPVDKLGRTPFAASFWWTSYVESDLKWCKILLDNGAKLDVLCTYPVPDNSFFGFCNKERPDMCKVPTGQCKVTPLIMAICHHDFKTAKFLLSHGANVNFPDERRRTPLMHAVRMNDIHLVKLLLNHQYNKDDDKKKAKKSNKTFGSKRTVHAITLQKQSLPKSLHSNPDMTQTNDETIKEEVNEQVNGIDDGEELVNHHHEVVDEEDDDIDLVVEDFDKTSKVDLSLCDNEGWTVIHHLVCALEYGTFENVKLLALLAQTGAPLHTGDKAGLTPLNYAVIRGANKLSKALQKLLKKDRSQWVKADTVKVDVKDGLSWNRDNLDYQKDSEEAMQSMTKSEETEEKEFWWSQPDSKSGLDETGEVLIDSELNIPYDVLLTKVDVNYGTWSLYNFYKMQIIHQKGKDLYFLFNNWGRMQDQGQHQVTPFPSMAEAIKEFQKIFKAKSGNDWQSIKSFTDLPGKYRLIKTEKFKHKKLCDVDINLETNMTTKLPLHLQALIKKLSNLEMLKEATQYTGIDISTMPFGRLTRECLLQGKDLIEQLRELISEKETLQDNSKGKEKYQQLCEKIGELSNEFYYLIPHGCAYERLPVIDNQNKWAESCRTVENLLELEIASKLLLAAEFRKKEINPLEYIYQCLHCQIQLMDESESESQYILRYVQASSKAKVECIYRLSRAGENERIANCGVDNHWLLWHGTRLSNLLGILSRGLVIAPPDAQISGHLFGKGIYTADAFTKSEGYCDESAAETESQFMLLCEVALGKIKEIKEADSTISNKFNSVKGTGRNTPDEKLNISLPTGVTIPLGKLKENWEDNDHVYSYYLNYNEYIVYKEDQVCLRYLVQFHY